MSEQQQPECPAEFRWMKPGEIGIQILSQQFVIIQSEPTYMCREWRVTVDYPDSAFGERTRNLSINCEVLENAKSDRTEIVSDLERLRNFRLFDLAKIEAQDKELESLRARLAEAEARASAEAAKVERVKALLDVVGPAVEIINNLPGCDEIGFERYERKDDDAVFQAAEGYAGASASLVSAISKIQDALNEK